MAGIGRKDTRPEMAVRRILHREGIRYVVNDRRLPGTPDIVMPRYRVCIFVHGCYWHRHAGCKYATTPSTRTDFWLTKFQANVTRDKRNIEELMSLGWRVLVLWECGLRRSNLEAQLDWLVPEVKLGELPLVVWPSGSFVDT